MSVNVEIYWDILKRTILEKAEKYEQVDPKIKAHIAMQTNDALYDKNYIELLQNIMTAEGRLSKQVGLTILENIEHLLGEYKLISKHEARKRNLIVTCDRHYAEVIMEFEQPSSEIMHVGNMNRQKVEKMIDRGWFVVVKTTTPDNIETLHPGIIEWILKKDDEGVDFQYQSEKYMRFNAKPHRWKTEIVEVADAQSVKNIWNGDTNMKKVDTRRIWRALMYRYKIYKEVYKELTRRRNERT
jgi:hypothetical protein